MELKSHSPPAPAPSLGPLSPCDLRAAIINAERLAQPVTTKMNHSTNAAGMPAGRGRVWRCAHRFALVVLGFLSGLCIAEITLRVFDLQPPSLRGKGYLHNALDPKASYICYSSNPNQELRPVPDASRGAWRLRSAS